MPQGPSRFVLPPPPSLSRTRAHVPMRGEKKGKRPRQRVCCVCFGIMRFLCSVEKLVGPLPLLRSWQDPWARAGASNCFGQDLSDR